MKIPYVTRYPTPIIGVSFIRVVPRAAPAHARVTGSRGQCESTPQHGAVCVALELTEEEERQHADKDQARAENVPLVDMVTQPSLRTPGNLLSGNKKLNHCRSLRKYRGEKGGTDTGPAGAPLPGVPDRRRSLAVSPCQSTTGSRVQ